MEFFRDPAGTMTPAQMQRAENIVADTFPGAHLPAYRVNQFWKYVDDEPTLIQKVRRINMESHTIEIPRFGVQDQILHGANELTAMLPPQWVKFETGLLYMTSFKVMAEVQFTYELLEDNVKKNSLMNMVLGEIRRKIPANLEMLILAGDKSIAPTTNDFLCMEDGLIKRCFTQAPAGRPSLGLTGAHLVDAMGQSMDTGLWYDLERAIPEKYSTHGSNYIYITHRDVELAWRESRTQRVTSVGDEYVFENKKAKALGREIYTSPFMPVDNSGNTFLVLLDPKQIVLGTYRSMTLESMRNIQNQKILFVWSTRIGLALEEPDSIGLVHGLPTGVWSYRSGVKAGTAHPY